MVGNFIPGAALGVGDHGMGGIVMMRGGLSWSFLAGRLENHYLDRLIFYLAGCGWGGVSVCLFLQPVWVALQGLLGDGVCEGSWGGGICWRT